MKKQIIVGIGIVACVALCVAVWPRSAEVEGLPDEPIEAAISTKIEATSEEIPSIFISADIPAPIMESVAESEPQIAEVTAEKETENPAPPTVSATQAVSKSTPASSKPKPENTKVVDGIPYIYVQGFGWIEDHSDESYGTFAADMYENGNKISVMGGAEPAPSNSPSQLSV